MREPIESSASFSKNGHTHLVSCDGVCACLHPKASPLPRSIERSPGVSSRVGLLSDDMHTTTMTHAGLDTLHLLAFDQPI